MISCQVPPDDQVPVEASQVPIRLGSQLLIAYRFVPFTLIKLPIETNFNSSIKDFKSDVQIFCEFVFEPEA